MPQHLVKFVADPTSSSSTELGYFFGNSLDEAKDKANASLPEYRAEHPTAGYRMVAYWNFGIRLAISHLTLSLCALEDRAHLHRRPGSRFQP
jgi:hypothetical protein